MRRLESLDQLTDYTPLNQPSDILRPWERDPADGLPTLADVTEDVEIETLDDVYRFLGCMGEFAIKFKQMYDYYGYPTFRFEEEAA